MIDLAARFALRRGDATMTMMRRCIRFGTSLPACSLVGFASVFACNGNSLDGKEPRTWPINNRLLTKFNCLQFRLSKVRRLQVKCKRTLETFLSKTKWRKKTMLIWVKSITCEPNIMVMIIEIILDKLFLSF